MAASLSSFDVATYIDRCRFATGCCEMHCNGCVKVARYRGCMRKSYWSGCIQATTVMKIFSILTLVIFLLNIIVKNTSKLFFCGLESRSGFGAAICESVAHSSIVFCNSISADRIVVAASRIGMAVSRLR